MFHRLFRLSIPFLSLTLLAGCHHTQPCDSPIQPTTLHLEWSFGPDMPVSNGGHMAAVMNNTIFVAGGTNWETSQKQWLANVYACQPDEKTWRQVYQLPQPTAYAAAGANHDSFYLCGGSKGSQGFQTCGRLTGHNDALHWQELPPLPESRVYPGGGLIKNTMYVVAGAVQPDDIHNVTKTLWALPLNKPRQTWRRLPDLPGPGRCVMASTTCGNELFVFGGCYTDEQNQVVNLADAYAYNSSNNQWRPLADLPYAMRGACAVGYKDRYIFLLGGQTADTAQTEKFGPEYGFQNKVMVYDKLTDTYAFSTSMPMNVAVGRALIINDTLYYCGGEDKMRHRSRKLLIGTITQP